MEQQVRIYSHYKDIYYRLTGYCASSFNEDEAQPCMYLYMHSQYSFKTFEEAEEKMKELSGGEFYCFFIHEIPFGVPIRSIYSSQRVLSYTGDGALNTECCTSNIEDKEGLWEMYWGRDPQECRFAPGDIVEVFYKDCVRLEIIAAYPPSKAFVADRQSVEMSEDFHFDYSDDCYLTLDGNDGHNHVSVENCFPVNACLLDRGVVERLEERYKKFQMELKK